MATYSLQRLAHIARDTTSTHLVSTVELSDGMFETMVFYVDARRRVVDWHEVWCERTRNESQARANHAAALAIYK